MDINSVSLKWRKNILMSLFVVFPFTLLAREHNPLIDSFLKSPFIIKPTLYANVSYVNPYKGGFPTNLDPKNFIYGTKFTRSTSGFEMSIGIPVLKYLGVCGQLNSMAVSLDLPENMQSATIYNVHFVQSTNKYTLSSNSAGLFISLPTKFFFIEIEGNIGKVTFSTPECGMWLNQGYDKYDITYTGIVHRGAHSYSTKIYAYACQCRLNCTKHITLSIRFSKYIIPKLIATSTNLDTRVSDYKINSTPDISFKYQAISIGLGVKFSAFHFNDDE